MSTAASSRAQDVQDHSLPAAFAALEPFVAEWALFTERERALKRVSTSMAHSRVFFDAAFPLLQPMLDYFRGFPNDPDALPPDAKRLYALASSLMEIAAPIDLEWESPDVGEMCPVNRLVFLPPSV